MQNKFPWIIGIVIVTSIAGLVFAGDKPAPASSPATQSASTTRHALPAGTVVYDVRTPDEYAAGHGTSAVLLPLADIEAGTYPDVAKTTPIAVYCRSGNRSAQAVRLLKQAGYTDITDIGAFGNLAHYGITTATP